MEWLQKKEIKMIKGLEGLTYEERLKELIMYSSDKGWVKRWFNNSLQILRKVSTVRKGEELFRVLHRGTTQVMEGKGKVIWDIGTMRTKPDFFRQQWVGSTNALEMLWLPIPKWSKNPFLKVFRFLKVQGRGLIGFSDASKQVRQQISMRVRDLNSFISSISYLLTSLQKTTWRSGSRTRQKFPHRRRLELNPKLLEQCESGLADLQEDVL